MVNSKGKNPLNVMLASLNKAPRTVETVKKLHSLQRKGLVNKIVVLDSSPDNSFIYPEDVSSLVDSEIERKNFRNIKQTMLNTLESVPGYKDGFDSYVNDIRDNVSSNDIDLVLANSDMGAYTLSYALPSSKRVSPDFGLLDLLQNKAKTYGFMRMNEICLVPDFRVVGLSSLYRHKDDLERFLEQNDGLLFAKPSNPRIGGSRGVGVVDSYDSLYALMEKNPKYGDYLVSEVLSGPELNHTVVLNGDGTINTQASYSEFEGGRNNNTPRFSVKSIELNDFAQRFGYSLRTSFPDSEIKGVYNLDFMRDNEGSYVLSEVNPGRLPANFGVFKPHDYNLLESVVNSFSGQDEAYDEGYDKGVFYQSP